MFGTRVLSTLANTIAKINSGLYRDNGLILIRNVNRQKTGRIRQEVIKIFIEIGFKTEFQTNLKVVDFLDIIYNKSNGTSKTYRAIIQ